MLSLMTYSLILLMKPYWTGACGAGLVCYLGGHPVRVGVHCGIHAGRGLRRSGIGITCLGCQTFLKKLQQSVDVVNILLDRFISLCHAIGYAGGRFAFEHPEDRGVAPYPSIWVLPAVMNLLAKFSCCKTSFDQFVYGAASRKGATIAGNIKT